MVISKFKNLSPRSGHFPSSESNTVIFNLLHLILTLKLPSVYGQLAWNTLPLGDGSHPLTTLLINELYLKGNLLNSYGTRGPLAAHQSATTHWLKNNGMPRFVQTPNQGICGLKNSGASEKHSLTLVGEMY